MTKIVCRASDCINWDDGLCSAEKIVYDPDQGCLTYEPLEEIVDEEEIWDDDLLEEDEEEEDLEWDDELDDEAVVDDDW